MLTLHCHCSTTHLTTQIEGYVQRNNIYLFWYRYLLVMSGNPLVPSSLVIEVVDFGFNSSSVATQLPTNYQSGHSLSVRHFLNKCQTLFLETDLIAANSVF